MRKRLKKKAERKKWIKAQFKRTEREFFRGFRASVAKPEIRERPLVAGLLAGIALAKVTAMLTVLVSGVAATGYGVLGSRPLDATFWKWLAIFVGSLVTAVVADAVRDAIEDRRHLQEMGGGNS